MIHIISLDTVAIVQIIPWIQLQLSRKFLGYSCNYPDNSLDTVAIVHTTTQNGIKVALHATYINLYVLCNFSKTFTESILVELFSITHLLFELLQFIMYCIFLLYIRFFHQEIVGFKWITSNVFMK